MPERVRPFSLMQRGDTFDFAQFQAKHIVIAFSDSNQVYWGGAFSAEGFLHGICLLFYSREVDPQVTFKKID